MQITAFLAIAMVWNSRKQESAKGRKQKTRQKKRIWDSFHSLALIMEISKQMI